MHYLIFALTPDILLEQRTIKTTPVVPIEECSGSLKENRPFYSFLKLPPQERRSISLALFKSIKTIYPGM